MANYTTNVVSTLPSQLLEVLRDQRMSFTQLSTYYSIKYRSSLHERLKGAKAANVKEYLEGLSNLFEVQGDTVKARPKNSDSEKPAITSIRYAHISKAIQNILNETDTKSLDMAHLEATFETKFKVSLVSIIGMPTHEYLQRKANVFEIDGTVVRLQSAFQKENELKNTKMEEKGVLGQIPEENDPEKPSKPLKSRQSWADLPVPEAPDSYQNPKGTPQMATMQPKDSVAVDGLLHSLGSTTSPGSASKDAALVHQVEVQPKARTAKCDDKPASQDKKSENLPLFAVDELVRIFEESSEGPIMHSSVLCSLFMQQLGASVTEISGKKPMALFREHPQVFIWLSSGNVALEKYRQDKAVQHELKLLEDQPKSMRVKAAAAEASLPVPEKVTEEDVVQYIVSLLQENEDRDSIYISALCGRFMQRYKKPVTEIVGCKPTDFLKKYKDVFYLEKGGHVKLVKGTESGAHATDATEANTAGGAFEASAQNSKKAQKEVVELQETSPISAEQPVVTETHQPSSAPWRRCAPEADKENVSRRQQTPNCEKAKEVQQKVEDFCSQLRKQLFFRVTEFSIGVPAATQSPGSIQCQPADIQVSLKVTNLPTEVAAHWLPKLLHGLQQVIQLKFKEEVGGLALEGEGLHCRLRNLSVGLFFRLEVV